VAMRQRWLNFKRTRSPYNLFAAVCACVEVVLVLAGVSDRVQAAVWGVALVVVCFGLARYSRWVIERCHPSGCHGAEQARPRRAHTAAPLAS
jgi:hypothetical protein